MCEDSLKPRRQRRSYSKQFKAQLVAQCLEGNVTLASLAVRHGMNPNVLHRWVTEHERYGRHSLDDLETERGGTLVTQAPANWIPVAPTPPAVSSLASRAAQQPSVRSKQSKSGVSIELSGHNGVQLKLHWPSDDPQGLARFARELLT